MVRLGLEAAATSIPQRPRALRLLYTVADSHSRLLCRAQNGQLSAASQAL